MSGSRPAAPRGWWRTFRWPLVIGLVSGLGLVAALLCDGAVDNLWSLAVAAPAMVVGVLLLRRPRP